MFENKTKSFRHMYTFITFLSVFTAIQTSAVFPITRLVDAESIARMLTIFTICQHAFWILFQIYYYNQQNIVSVRTHIFKYARSVCFSSLSFLRGMVTILSNFWCIGYSKLNNKELNQPMYKIISILKHACHVLNIFFLLIIIIM